MRLLPPLPALQAWLRVALGYHTAPQVVVGWLVGGTSAACWFQLGQAWLLPTLGAQPAALTWLHAATAFAAAFFAATNVWRWVKEHRLEAKVHAT